MAIRISPVQRGRAAQLAAGVTDCYGLRPRNDRGGRRLVPFRRGLVVIAGVYCGTAIAVPYNRIRKNASFEAFQTVEAPPILPPAFMRGVPEGRGESEYLHSKYSEMPTFL